MAWFFFILRQCIYLFGGVFGACILCSFACMPFLLAQGGISSRDEWKRTCLSGWRVWRPFEPWSSQLSCPERIVLVAQRVALLSWLCLALVALTYLVVGISYQLVTGAPEIPKIGLQQ